LILRGETNIRLYRHNSNRLESEQGTTVPSKWHGSNRSNSGSQQAGKSACFMAFPSLLGCWSDFENQCAGTASSVARPRGGTTTVDRLPSAVSF
jgi:hypothetical protein